ncbi:Uncharacterised protein [uncultured archaeon]|nr:Uncharacterised protein [uncultured archaeon]
MKEKKRELLILLSILIIVLSLELVLSVEITLSKESYSPRETLQAQIKGTFISLSSDNILIYEGNKVHSEPVIKSLTKQNNIYYLYMLLPNKESNFSLRIEGAEYIDSGEIKSGPIIKPFSIMKTNESSLSLYPGFIITDKGISIKVKSLSNQEISVTFDGTGETKNLSLTEEKEETIDFSTLNLSSGQSNLRINNYNIPVFIFAKSSSENISDLIRLDFNPPELRAKLISGKDYSFTIVIENSGNMALNNISISNNVNATIFPYTIKSLRPGDNVYLNLTIPVPEQIKDNLSGYIKISSQEKNFSVPVILEITTNQKEVNLTQTGVTKSLSCINIGNICIEGQECTGEITSSLEGPCCLGPCSEIKKTSYSWLFGLVLVLIIIGALAYVYFKSKQKGKLKSTGELLKQKSNDFEERMSGKEVSGRLGRI